MIRSLTTLSLHKQKSRFGNGAFDGSDVSLIDDVDDLTELSVLTDKTILENLHIRYQNCKIYTYIGSILIAVNPFKQISSLFGLKVWLF